MSVTLDSIRQAADAKYGSYDIELTDGTVVRLLNPLRLSDEKRAELKAAQKALSASTDDDEAEDVDQVTGFENVLRVVAQTPEQGDALCAAVNRDLAVLAEIFRAYGKNTQVGEA